MSFIIDKQSLDELNILGKFRQGSVYQLFDRVRTRGGEKLLEKMYRNPSTDPSVINARTEIFGYFRDASLAFPFDPGQVLLMQEYTDAAGRQGRLGALASVVVQKTLSVLAHDDRFKVRIQGLQATLIVLKRCYALVENLLQQPGPFRERVQSVHRLLTNKEMAELLEVDIYTNISISNIARFDCMIRNTQREACIAILDFIFECDVNIAVGAIAAQPGFTFAQALPAGRNMLEADNLRHPCVDKAVGNNISLRQDHNVVFLTGANMAGKSTWMKSVGIAVYLAHTGFPIAADAMVFSVREGIFSSINVADNISLGYSHFYAEVVRVREAAEAAATGRHLLLMFDELFKGTNVKDAYDGTLAVTEGFAEYQHCLFIVSTHIIEVGSALKKYPNIQFAFMPTVMEGAHPRYTYRLKEGITEDRQGMMIIRNEGILELIRS